MNIYRGIAVLAPLLYLLIVGVPQAHCGIIAKSSIEKCNNYGPDEPTGPNNVTCSNKLVVAVTVMGGQNNTETIEAIVDTVTVNDTQRQLVSPLRLSLAKTKPMIIYALDYVQNVNNKPWEYIMYKDNTLGGVVDACYDGFKQEATCGFFFDGNGNKIVDSQGFCCKCTIFSDATYTRTGLNCGGFSTAASASCLRFDPLWYSLYQMGPPQLFFVITVAVEKYNNDTGNYEAYQYIDIGPMRRGAKTEDGSVTAVFQGEFMPTVGFQEMQARYFAIPSPPNQPHEQCQNGMKDWMVIDKPMVDLSGSTCNKIGVSFSAFRNQPNACTQPAGSCLLNQIRDLWEQDTLARAENKVGDYFVDNFGDFGGVWQLTSGQERFASWISNQIHSSLVTIELFADDIRFITNVATGEIMAANISTFEAVTNQGRLVVKIQNTGRINADFFVSVANCTYGVQPIPEQHAYMAIGQIRSLTFAVNVIIEVSQAYQCTVVMQDADYNVIDTELVGFFTLTTNLTNGTQDGVAPKHVPTDKGPTGDALGKGFNLNTLWTILKAVGIAVASILAVIGGLFALSACFPGIAAVLAPVLGALTCACCCKRRRKHYFRKNRTKLMWDDTEPVLAKSSAKKQAESNKDTSVRASAGSKGSSEGATLRADPSAANSTAALVAGASMSNSLASLAIETLDQTKEGNGAKKEASFTSMGHKSRNSAKFRSIRGSSSLVSDLDPSRKKGANSKAAASGTEFAITYTPLQGQATATPPAESSSLRIINGDVTLDLPVEGEEAPPAWNSRGSFISWRHSMGNDIAGSSDSADDAPTTDQLDVAVLHKTPVYFNYYAVTPDAVEGLMQYPGPEFSLEGFLHMDKTGYVFSLGDRCSQKRTTEQALSRPFRLEANNFLQHMERSAATAYVTLTPRYTCVNEGQ